MLEYRFSEDNDGEVDGSLLLMTPSSFMSPTKEASPDLSPMDPISQARECRSRDPQKLLHESPRRRKIEESMRVSFLSTLPEEDWERYQSELESKTGTTWSRVNFMERSWDVIRRYGTQSIMKVGLNQPTMREVLEKIMNSMESDVLTESVTEDSADDQHSIFPYPFDPEIEYYDLLIVEVRFPGFFIHEGIIRHPRYARHILERLQFP